jgi:hypothetical protein
MRNGLLPAMTQILIYASVNGRSAWRLAGLHQLARSGLHAPPEPDGLPGEFHLPAPLFMLRKSESANHTLDTHLVTWHIAVAECHFSGLMVRLLNEVAQGLPYPKRGYSRPAMVRAGSGCICGLPHHPLAASYARSRGLEFLACTLDYRRHPGDTRNTRDTDTRALADDAVFVSDEHNAELRYQSARSGISVLQTVVDCVSA